MTKSQSSPLLRSSCADLIRASIPLHEMHFTQVMDCRVKPGNDDHESHGDKLRAEQ
jgi:hypothetical protein